MAEILLNFWLSFLAGLFAPLGAVCVLPLYPGFLSFLSNQLSGSSKIEERKQKKRIVMFGWIVALGVITSMLLVGLIFSKFLEASLTNAISIISPIAFGILALVSLLLIFNFDLGTLFPKFTSPVTKNPYLTSFIFGFFFGAIVLPCNPASLIVIFAISVSTMDFLFNTFNFLFFGVGMALPLLVFAYISQTADKVIGFLTRNKRGINLVAGIVMLIISLYYLIFVFKVFG